MNLKNINKNKEVYKELLEDIERYSFKDKKRLYSYDGDFMLVKTLKELLEKHHYEYIDKHFSRIENDIFIDSENMYSNGEQLVSTQRVIFEIIHNI